ncbi:UbiA family prenyltransferase [Candidatus Laterigemmans baculatus]|uniref:UbiA family prenyltransferase n=1 Tax=Candidatus Laterigemmans baculatus TaxID=2770505 RepID=UPI0013D97277|nr:UbiA family prenyltransferase [Candidatus Laterigemmans baculatus]
MHSPTHRTTWMDWARLVRLPNVFTILADVGAAFLLVAHSHEPLSRFLCVLAAGVCLYWAGMVLNDVFDLEIDRDERPTRPLPAGRISLSAAKTAGWALLICGVGMAALSGFLPAEDLPATWRPGLIGVLLAVAIVLYDGPLKATAVAPLAMGLCRALSFLLGASPILSDELAWFQFQPHVLAAASGFGIYVMGITLMARHEAGVSETTKLAAGLVVLFAGCGLLAFSPQLAGADAGLHFAAGPFALLIALLSLTTLVRSAKIFTNPSPERVQLAVKVALLTLIPLAAAFALLGAGPFYGLAIFGLVFPATLLAARFQMT